MPPEESIPSENIQYVLKGGALLHRIMWNRGSSYDSIWKQYVYYVKTNYGKPTVVFDSYMKGPSTKVATHWCACTSFRINDIQREEAGFFLQQRKQGEVYHIAR